ncbi:WYL domain-containing protein [bacterium]|nr:WYL domain-containing protein [bacterium]
MAELKPLERALRILQRLSTHDRVTVNELYRLFDGRESVRSIQRSLDTIQSSNIPLKVESGPHNEYMYTLHRAFDYIPQLLEPGEMLATMFLAPFISFFEGTRVGEDIQAAFKKIDHLMPSDSIAFTSALHGLGESFRWQEPGKVQLTQQHDFLTQLMRAVTENRKCHVQYTARGERKSKEFDFCPYSLLFHTGGIYVVVNIPPHDNFFYIAVQRIKSLKVADDHFERRPEFSLEEFLEHNFGIWSGKPTKVHLLFAPQAAPSIEERNWHPSQKIRKRENGKVELTMNLGISEEFIAWILRWGQFVEVIEPASLRDQIRSRLESALSIYK